MSYQLLIILPIILAGVVVVGFLVYWMWIEPKRKSPVAPEKSRDVEHEGEANKSK